MTTAAMPMMIVFSFLMEDGTSCQVITGDDAERLRPGINTGIAPSSLLHVSLLSPSPPCSGSRSKYVPEVVGNLEADPLVGPRPLQLEVSEAESSACISSNPFLIPATAIAIVSIMLLFLIFSFFLASVPGMCLADIAYVTSALREFLLEKAQTGPICARSVHVKGTRHGGTKMEM